MCSYVNKHEALTPTHKPTPTLSYTHLFSRNGPKLLVAGNIEGVDLGGGIRRCVEQLRHVWQGSHRALGVVEPRLGFTVSGFGFKFMLYLNLQDHSRTQSFL